MISAKKHTQTAAAAGSRRDKCNVLWKKEVKGRKKKYEMIVPCGIENSTDNCMYIIQQKQLYSKAIMPMQHKGMLFHLSIYLYNFLCILMLLRCNIYIHKVYKKINNSPKKGRWGKEGGKEGTLHNNHHTNSKEHSSIKRAIEMLVVVLLCIALLVVDEAILWIYFGWISFNSREKYKEKSNNNNKQWNYRKCSNFVCALACLADEIIPIFICRAPTDNDNDDDDSFLSHLTSMTMITDHGSMRTMLCVGILLLTFPLHFTSIKLQFKIIICSMLVVVRVCIL